MTAAGLAVFFACTTSILAVRAYSFYKRARTAEQALMRRHASRTMVVKVDHRAITKAIDKFARENGLGR